VREHFSDARCVSDDAQFSCAHENVGANPTPDFSDAAGSKHFGAWWCGAGEGDFLHFTQILFSSFSSLDDFARAAPMAFGACFICVWFAFFFFFAIDIPPCFIC